MPPSTKTKVKKPSAPAPAVKAGAGASGELTPIERVRRARQQGLLPVARQLLDGLLKQSPNDPVLLRELVMLYIASEDDERAHDLLLTITQKNAKDHWAWLMLARCNAKLGKSAAEEKALDQAVAIKPEEPALRRLFELKRDTGDMKAALDIVRQLRAIRDTKELEIAEAKLLARTGDPDASLKQAQAMMDRNPPVEGAAEQWAAILLAERHQPELVVAEMQKRINAGRKEAIFYSILSRAYGRMDRTKEATQALKQALEISPDHHQWWYDLAVQQRQMGEIDESQVSFERALELNPLEPTTLRVYGAEAKFNQEDIHFKRINQALAALDTLPKQKQIELHYAAAKAYEDIGELDTAFAHYLHGGRKQTEVSPYKHAGSEGLLRTMRLGMKPAVYERIKEPGDPSNKPVFVLGMPRSGTSLTEQIIASHPQAYGAGELKLLHRVLDGISVNGNRIQTNNDPGVITTYIPGVDLSQCATMSFKARGELYAKAISVLAGLGGKPEALRVVDKMPGNYFWTGLIPFVLPGAKIIHTRRHPMDTCLSNYRIFFPDGMPWSYDLRNLGKCYRLYDEHMKHWESNLPDGMMLSIRYEETVADLELMAKRIIDHIDLPWDENCLKFYETERPVKTASLGQVRRPIYNSSVGRWRKYEKYLKPLLDEIGPLVEEYEAELEAASKESKQEALA
jgi:tetratricopeptide (TPR) repeat protein